MAQTPNTLPPNEYEHKEVSHQKVAYHLGLSKSGVCRIRQGDRTPSRKVMLVIEKEFGWPVAEQFMARDRGDYAAEFEFVIEAKFFPGRVRA
jgi:ribosome-binding protein aMBF1 (putative translation factor)